MKTNVSNLKVYAFLILALLPMAFLCSCGSKDAGDIDLKGIKDCKELEVAKFNFHKIIVNTLSVEVFSVMGCGFNLPERILILPVDVNVIGKIDFSNVTKDNISIDEDGLVFTLPDPTLELTSMKADNETRSKASKEQWYRGGRISDENRKQALKQTKDSIMVEKTLMMMAKRTRENAAMTIIPILSDASGLPVEKIEVRFSSDLNLSSADYNEVNNTIIFRRKE